MKINLPNALPLLLAFPFSYLLTYLLREGRHTTLSKSGLCSQTPRSPKTEFYTSSIKFKARKAETHLIWQIGNLDSPLCMMMLDKSLPISEPQIPYLSNGVITPGVITNRLLAQTWCIRTPWPLARASTLINVTPQATIIQPATSFASSGPRSFLQCPSILPAPPVILTEFPCPGPAKTASCAPLGCPHPPQHQELPGKPPGNWPPQACGPRPTSACPYRSACPSSPSGAQSLSHNSILRLVQEPPFPPLGLHCWALAL